MVRKVEILFDLVGVAYDKECIDSFAEGVNVQTTLLRESFVGTSGTTNNFAAFLLVTVLATEEVARSRVRRLPGR